MDLKKNQVILITGASSGIGEALVNHLLATNATIIGLSRNPCKITSARYHHYICDVADAKSVKNTFVEIRKSFPKISALINNAGALSVFSTLLMPPRLALEMIETNFYGAFLVAQESSKLMIGNGYGRIIQISSMAEILEPVGDAIYAASKAAATSMTNSLSKELASYGITCNTLAITYFPTRMSKKINSMTLKKVVEELPSPGPAKLIDITNVIDFYLNPDSDGITGQFIALGGLHK